MRYEILIVGVLFFLSGCAPESAIQQRSSVRPASGSGISCSSGVECQNIGLQYVGKADQKNYAIASKYFKRSCDYGLSEGCNNLAFLYANARGVDQSYTLAYQYWGKACRMGNQAACSNLELAKDKVAEMHKKK